MTSHTIYPVNSVSLEINHWHALEYHTNWQWKSITLYLGFNRQECLHPSYLLKVGDANIMTNIPIVIPNYGPLKSACQNRPEWVRYCQHWPNTCPISYWHVHRMHKPSRTCKGLSWQKPQWATTGPEYNQCSQHWVNSNPVLAHYGMCIRGNMFCHNTSGPAIKRTKGQS